MATTRAAAKNAALATTSASKPVSRGTTTTTTTTKVRERAEGRERKSAADKPSARAVPSNRPRRVSTAPHSAPSPRSNGLAGLRGSGASSPAAGQPVGEPVDTAARRAAGIKAPAKHSTPAATRSALFLPKTGSAGAHGALNSPLTTLTASPAGALTMTRDTATSCADDNADNTDNTSNIDDNTNINDDNTNDNDDNINKDVIDKHIVNSSLISFSLEQSKRKNSTRPSALTDYVNESLENNATINKPEIICQLEGIAGSLGASQVMAQAIKGLSESVQMIHGSINMQNKLLMALSNSNDLLLAENIEMRKQLKNSTETMNYNFNEKLTTLEDNMTRKIDGIAVRVDGIVLTAASPPVESVNSAHYTPVRSKKRVNGSRESRAREIHTEADMSISDSQISDTHTTHIAETEQHTSQTRTYSHALASGSAGTSRRKSARERGPEHGEVVVSGVVDCAKAGVTPESVALVVLGAVLPGIEQSDIISVSFHSQANRGGRARARAAMSEKTPERTHNTSENAQGRGSSSRPASMLVRLSSKDLSRKILTARHALTGFGTSDLDLSRLGEGFTKHLCHTNIYISENLSHEVYKDFVGLKIIARNLGFRYVWHRDGKFLARRREGERAFAFQSAADLEAIFESHKVKETRATPLTTKPST